MGVVYMLASENDHYIGSTIMTLNKRIRHHKNSYNSWLKDKTNFCNSYEIIKNDNYEVIEIEEVENETEKECREREQFWINFYGKENLINKFNANGLNIENKKEIDKKYYENNKEKMKKYYKEYYEKNKKLNI